MFTFINLSFSKNQARIQATTDAQAQVPQERVSHAPLSHTLILISFSEITSINSTFVLLGNMPVFLSIGIQYFATSNLSSDSFCKKTTACGFPILTGVKRKSLPSDFIKNLSHNFLFLKVMSFIFEGYHIFTVKRLSSKATSKIHARVSTSTFVFSVSLFSRRYFI
jgi:hypothetical protein